MSKNTDGVHRNRGNKTKLNVVLEWSVLSLNMQEVIFVFKVNQYCLMLRYIVCETVVDSRKVINLCQRLFFFVSRIDIGPEVSSSQPYHNQKPCCFLIVKYHSHRVWKESRSAWSIILPRRQVQISGECGVRKTMLDALNIQWSAKPRYLAMSTP